MTGSRFGHLVVIETLTGGEVDQPSTGTWCRVRCDCGRRMLVGARQLRFRVKQSNNISCGCTHKFSVQMMATARRSFASSPASRSHVAGGHDLHAGTK